MIMVNYIIVNNSDSFGSILKTEFQLMVMTMTMTMVTVGVTGTVSRQGQCRYFFESIHTFPPSAAKFFDVILWNICYFDNYVGYYEMSQKACERYIFHVMAYDIFSKCPKTFSVPFLF